MNHDHNYFNSYSRFLKSHFGKRIQKLSVNTGGTCPNRDGSKGTGGCIYCFNEAFTPSYCQSEKPIRQQLTEGIDFHKNRYKRADNYLAYFQSFTNTYTSVSHLRSMMDEALSVHGISGIVLGTRPDCIDSKIISLLEEYNWKTFLKIELGIESVYDETLKFINRGHTFHETRETISQLRSAGIRTGGHFILGLPGESRDMILHSAEIIGDLGLFSLKLHQMQILANTKLAELYIQQPDIVELFELSEYIDFAVSFTEHLHPSIFIERFAAEVPPRFLVAPDWGMIRYDQILQKIIGRFRERRTYQGRLQK